MQTNALVSWACGHGISITGHDLSHTTQPFNNNKTGHAHNKARDMWNKFRAHLRTWTGWKMASRVPDTKTWKFSNGKPLANALLPRLVEVRGDPKMCDASLIPQSLTPTTHAFELIKTKSTHPKIDIDGAGFEDFSYLHIFKCFGVRYKIGLCLIFCTSLSTLCLLHWFCDFVSISFFYCLSCLPVKIAEML